MENIESTFTNNSLTRYYEERINYLEREKERLTNEARADFRIALEFWVYSNRIVLNYLAMHKTSSHNVYLDCIKTMLQQLEAIENVSEDTSINRLRLQLIDTCNESIVKCEKYNETK
jgi:hypothetical protein